MSHDSVQILGMSIIHKLNTLTCFKSKHGKTKGCECLDLNFSKDCVHPKNT